jgi:hypothetical protein
MIAKCDDDDQIRRRPHRSTTTHNTPPCCSFPLLRCVQLGPRLAARHFFVADADDNNDSTHGDEQASPWETPTKKNQTESLFENLMRNYWFQRPSSRQ